MENNLRSQREGEKTDYSNRNYPNNDNRTSNYVRRDYNKTDSDKFRKYSQNMSSNPYNKPDDNFRRHERGGPNYFKPNFPQNVSLIIFYKLIFNFI
jgi:hypothetical protein